MAFLTSSVQGYVSWEIIKESTGIVVRRSEDETKNLIVNNGLNEMVSLSPSSLAGICRVGTGTNPPAITDTDLQSRVGLPSAQAASPTYLSSSTAPYYQQVTQEYLFNASAGITGVPLTELGFFQNSTAPLFSRLLFKDSGGTPISITLLAGEQLKVTYALRRYLPNMTTPMSGNITVNVAGTPTVFPYQARIFDVLGLHRDMNFFTVTPIWYENNVLVPSPTTASPSLGGLASGNTGTALNSTYVQGSYQRSFGATLTISQANFPTGIGGIGFRFSGSSSSGLVHLAFPTKIPKTNTQTLSFSNLITLGWGRGELT